MILERQLCIEGHVPAPAQLPCSTCAPHMYLCHPSHSTPPAPPAQHMLPTYVHTPQAPHPTHATTQAPLPPFSPPLHCFISWSLDVVVEFLLLFGFSGFKHSI